MLWLVCFFFFSFLFFFLFLFFSVFSLKEKQRCSFFEMSADDDFEKFRGCVLPSAIYERDLSKVKKLLRDPATPRDWAGVQQTPPLCEAVLTDDLEFVKAFFEEPGLDFFFERRMLLLTSSIFPKRDCSV